MSEEFYDVETVTLELADGTVQDCAILDEFEALGRNYIALAPILDDETLSDETYLYRCEDDGEYINMEYIEDEKEMAEVSEIYEKLCEEFEDDEEE